jgi:peptide/nickel transport system substrate-binding protein/oligopeptide transport system substrate-binding protein
VLVESLPETSPDGRIYTFRLRRGIRFSNGDPLTSRDVVVTFERFFDPEVSPNPSDFASIEGGLAFADARLKERSAPANNDRKPGTRWIEPTTVPGVEAPDDFTIRIRLTQPDLAFLPQLSKQCVVPRLAAGAGMAFGTRPIGSGPLVLRRWDRGTRMRFERNPHYSPPSQPRPDAVEVQIGITGETQAMMFERGELDLLDGLNGPDFLRFRRDPRMSPTLRVVRETSARYVALNCELPPFTNRWVRQALNHAVNREALVRAISGRAGVAPGPVASVITERHPSLPRYAHDPARARELLRLAGWPNGFSSVLWVMRGAPIEVRMAQILQQSLRDIGVNIQIKETSFAAFWDSISRRREVPMALTGWTPDFNDPKNPLSLFDADNIHDEGSLNPCFYANPAVQTLFRAANVEVQPARRFERLREAERLIVEDAPAIFLVHLHAESAIQPWVRDYVPGGFWPTVRIENCWIAP